MGILIEKPRTSTTYGYRYGTLYSYPGNATILDGSHPVTIF